MPCRLLALLLCTLGAPALAQAQTAFYVSMTGKDVWPGTVAQPWRTIQNAANLATAGSTVYVRGGVYNERVTVNVSGDATSGPVTFRNYGTENAIVDGTGLTVPAAESGLFLVADRSYVVIKGFEIRSYKTAVLDRVPVGIHVRGVCDHVEVRGNRIHDIQHLGTAKNGVDAHGIAAYGTDAVVPITNLVIDGNELYDLKLGSSESLAVNGNVDGFKITRNKVHDNDNIGIVAIGFEGTSSDPATDQARNGLIARNTVFNITSYGNPAYGNEYGADGLYVDGGRDITIERNVVHHVDIGIEMASEHAGRATSNVVARGNFVYLNRVVGISIGGYDNLRGRTEGCTIVNNTLFRNDQLGWGNGELMLQYDTRTNTIANNIFSATAQGYLVTNAYTENTANVLDGNIYFVAGGGAATWQWKNAESVGFAQWQTDSGQDAHSRFLNPKLVSASTPDLHLRATSPAKNTGLPYPPLTVGAKDIDGQARVQGAAIDVGADETP